MRVVSLCPSLTELVFHLGSGSRLVGITKFCTAPAEGVRNVAKVGGTKNPNLRRIRELSPDLVLLNEEENRVEDASALQASGIRCLSTFPRTLTQTAESVRTVGAALDASGAAERLAQEILAAAERAKARSSLRPRSTFAYLIWKDPWMTVNGDTFISDLLVTAGGVNVYADAPARYPEITAQDLGARAPDHVLLSSEPYPFTQEHVGELRAKLVSSRSRIRCVDGELLSWHGPRTPDGVELAVRLFDPDAG